jgi:ketosteroid isomerase-like protein
MPEEVVRRLFALAAAGDVEGYLELVDPDVTARPLTGRRVYRGHEGIRQFFADAPGDAFSVDGLRLYVRGDTAVATATLLAPSSLGGVLRLPAAWLLRLRGGKLIETRSFHRSADAFREAGLPEVPQPSE